MTRIWGHFVILAWCELVTFKPQIMLNQYSWILLINWVYRYSQLDAKLLGAQILWSRSLKHAINSLSQGLGELWTEKSHLHPHFLGSFGDLDWLPKNLKTIKLKIGTRFGDLSLIYSFLMKIDLSYFFRALKKIINELVRCLILFLSKSAQFRSKFLIRSLAVASFYLRSFFIKK